LKATFYKSLPPYLCHLHHFKIVVRRTWMFSWTQGWNSLKSLKFWVPIFRVMGVIWESSNSWWGNLHHDHFAMFLELIWEPKSFWFILQQPHQRQHQILFACSEGFCRDIKKFLVTFIKRFVFFKAQQLPFGCPISLQKEVNTDFHGYLQLFGAQKRFNDTMHLISGPIYY
jgi:hypothetical protein